MKSLKPDYRSLFYRTRKWRRKTPLTPAGPLAVLYERRCAFLLWQTRLDHVFLFRRFTTLASDVRKSPTTSCGASAFGMTIFCVEGFSTSRFARDSLFLSSAKWEGNLLLMTRCLRVTYRLMIESMMLTRPRAREMVSLTDTSNNQQKDLMKAKVETCTW